MIYLEVLSDYDYSRFSVRQAVAYKEAKASQVLSVKDVGDDTSVKRSESLETWKFSKVKVLPHEHWCKLGSLIQGDIVRCCLKGMWELKSP